MTFRVLISPQARRDIDRNADWWADHLPGLSASG
jgi:hypothetical protein